MNDLFQTIRTHLLTQKARCIVGDRCQYRVGELRCAVGCLITDEWYSERFESLSIVNGEVQNAIQKSIGRELEGWEYEMLKRLQQIHDRRAVEDWCGLLEEVRIEYNGYAL